MRKKSAIVTRMWAPVEHFCNRLRFCENIVQRRVQYFPTALTEYLCEIETICETICETVYQGTEGGYEARE